MQWQQAVLLGATGGLVVEVITVWGAMTAWQRDRHHARAGKKRALPTLSKYIDLPADTLVALTRLVLGAAAGGLMHDQITGTMAAIAVGAAAPALLRQLGSSRTGQGDERLDASSAHRATEGTGVHLPQAASSPAASTRQEQRHPQGAIE